MEIKINLTERSHCQLECDSTIVLPEKQVTLAFASATYKDLTLKVFARCNNKNITATVSKNEPLDITEILAAGTLEVKIYALVNGAIVKTWELKPLIVKEIQGEFELKDLLSDLEERIKVLEAQHQPIL